MSPTEHQRICSVCKTNKLSKSNPSDICYSCQEKIIKKADESELTEHKESLPESPKNLSPFVTTSEYAKAAHISPSAVVKQIKKKIIKGKKLNGGRKWLISREQYEKIQENPNSVRVLEGNKQSQQIKPTDEHSIQEVPLPDAGLRVPLPLTPMPVYSLDRITFPLLPFDIGTVFGLDRGSFTGILAGPCGKEVYRGLMSVERALYEAVREKVPDGNPPPALLTRWWIELDPSQMPNGPQNIEKNVWACAVDNSDKRVLYLINGGLSDSFIPGIFFDINSQEYNEGLFYNLQQWCQDLANGVFRYRQPAIVIHVTGDAFDETIEVAQGLKRRLEKSGNDFSRTIRTFYRPQNTFKPTLHEEANIDVDTIGLETGPGSYLTSWVTEAIKKSRSIKMDANYSDKYTAVMRLYRSLNPDANHSVFSSAQQVVADLDNIISTRGINNGEIDRQFISLIGESLPGRINMLIGAYARSARPVARRESLIYASSSEALMDAWVSGSGLEPDRMPTDEELRADNSQGSFIDNFILALLRRYNQEHRPELKKIIQDRQHLLNSAQRAVCDFCLEAAEMGQFWNRYGAREFHFLYQSGADIQLPINFLNGDMTNEPDLWWLLEACRVDKGRLIRLLSLDFQHRAILGLNTPEELKRVEIDSGLVALIKYHRRIS